MKSIRSVLLYLLCSIVASGLAQNVQLTPQYDDPATKLRIFTVHRSLVLHCDVTPGYATLELTWTRDGKDVRQVPELQNRFEILAAENKFVIDRTVEEDHGIFACELPSLNQSAQFNVVANVASRLTKDTQLIEGESLWIVCRVIGTNPMVTWILPNNVTIYNTTGHIILEHENGIANSALYIASVRMEDRGNYACLAENAASSVTGFEPSIALGMVRVRSKLAPLWPVCGILAQCFVLFVVLFIYEKYFHENEDIELDEEDYTAYTKGADKYNRKDKTY